MKNLYLILIFIFSVSIIISQGEGNNWYFGNYAGLSFSTNPPSVLNDGHLTTGEGSAVVSGKNGALVFYTSGSSVWGANHALMPNGTGLLGSSSSTQSAVICPKPGTYNYALKRYDNYFIITIADVGGPGGIRFSEVDMTLNGGLGDIVSTNKNTHLFGTTTMEGANVAKHANGCDFWIIGKPVGNNEVLAYHISPAGVNTTPIVNATGPVIGAGWGTIKVSPNSKVIGLASNGSGANRTNIYNFNNSTGIVTHKYTAGAGGYSLEFSADNEKVYSTLLNNANIYQYDLTTTTQANFIASQTIIGTTANTVGYRMCGLQLAPNGKIYAALHGQTRLGVINNPNVLGTGCNYDDNGVSIAGVNSFSGTTMSSSLGLPAFPSFFVTEPIRIKSSFFCYNDQTRFKLSDTTDMNNVDWFWSATGSPLPSTPSSTDWEPTIQYATPGDYAVLSVAYFPCFTDSIYDTITITAVNDVNLGNDTVFCDGNSAILDAGGGYDYYTWHNGDDSQTFIADTSGQYIVEVANVGANLVTNGDFEQGNSGFSSDYNYFITTNTVAGQYTVGSTPPSYNSGWSNCVDHTSSLGNMMIVNGATVANEFVWCQEVAVSPNTDYVFSLWGQAIYNIDPAILQFSINGNPVGTNINFTSTTCVWEEFYEVWNSGSNTVVEICILNQNTAGGNDFAIDDIFFAPLCKTSDTINVIVGEVPVANFSLIDSCEYLAVNYSDLSTVSLPESISAWSWDVDNDGTEDYNTQTPSHMFTPGSYISKLTVTSALGCSKDTMMPVLIYPKPQANFTFSEECLYDSLAFIDASLVSGGGAIISHGWNFGESVSPPIQSTLANPYHTYTSEGSYSVSEVVMTANGCLDTVSQQVEVFAVPVAIFSTADVCLDVAADYTDQSTLTNGTIIDWAWDFGDLNTGTDQNESHSYFADGTYPIQLIVTTSNNCKDTVSQNIVVFPIPQVAFSMQDDCLEETIQFTDNSIINIPGTLTLFAWDFGDLSSPSSIQSPIHLYESPGTYDVTLSVVSGDNCVSNLQQSVTVHPLPQVSFVASEICVNEPPTTFTNTSVIASGTNVSYSWNFGDVSNTVSTVESPMFNYNSHGEYEVMLAVVSDMGCMDTIIDTVKVKHKPTALFTQDTTGGCAPICVNFASQSLDSIGISSWNWQFENSLGEGSNKYEGYCYNNAGIYDVKLIVENVVGCFDTVESLGLISTYSYPIAEFELTPENTEVTDAEITFTNLSTDAVIWKWNFDDTELDSVNFDPVHVYQDTGVYLVELTVYNANGCSSTAYHQVIISPIENVFVPTAFSPNGDGENDILFVRGYLNGVYFSVYDRWGKKVFESNSSTVGWDGMINGKAANEGVYMWYLQTSINGEGKKFKGDVSLMR